jgi:hypothetical protein
MDPVGPVRLSKTTWFRTQWVPINQPMAATITVSDTVQSGTGYISNNYQATSAVPTEGKEAHRPAGPSNTSPRFDRSGFALQDLEADVSSTEIDGIVAQMAFAQLCAFGLGKLDSNE